MSVLDGYGDAHRLFLQSLVDHSMYTQDDALKLANTAAAQVKLTGLKSQSELVDFVGLINTKLKDLQMKVMSIKSQATKETHYALVNQVDDTAAEYATESDKAGIELYNLLIDAILSADGSISKGDAILCAREVKAARKSNTEVEECIVTWMAEGWLEYAGRSGKAAHITLGPRAMLELDTYMKDRQSEGEEIPVCPICSRLAIVGERCGSCTSKLCAPCFDTMHDKAQKKMRCPTCKAGWEGSHDEDAAGPAAGMAVAEDAAMDEDAPGPAAESDTPEPKRSSRRSGRSGR
eukprot:m.22812 g.22812  ORF g.22812 m.22812 type:complete len:292 (+) comp10819_c0_seq1:45-920(+)